MLQTILSLYLKSLMISAGIIVFLSLCWFIFRAAKGLEKTAQERQEFLYDLLMINVMTIPIFSFGIISILLMLRG